MADIRSKMGSSKYFKSADLANGPIQGTITSCDEVMLGIGGQAEDKMVLYFSEHEKGLVLNKTNANNIGDVVGFETDNWPGVKVELYGATTDYQGRTVDCIRVRVLGRAEPTSQPASAPPTSQPPLAF